MRWWSKLRLRLRSLFQADVVERELEAELRFHVDQIAAEHVAAGMDPKAARSAAIRAMGGMARVVEECRDARGVSAIDSLFRDIRFSVRMAAKHPAFTAVAVFTLAVGVGFNTLAYSASRALLDGALPVDAPDRLVLGEALREGFDPAGTSLLEYPALRDRADVFSSTALSIDRSFLLRGNTDAEQVHAAAVSPAFLETLGARPILGRDFSREESRAGGPSAVLLAYSLWQRRFAADPGVIGQPLDLDNRSYTIVGVMPRGFDYPTRTQAWVPLEIDPETAPLALRTTHSYIFVARLRPGVSPSQAGDAVRQAARDVARAFPQTERGWGYGLLTMRQWSIGDDDGRVTKAMVVMLLAIGFLLVVCCVNVAGLLFVRGVVRERELAIRVGLGATARRITQQLFTEGAMLALAGGAAGLALAWFLRPLFASRSPIHPHAFADIATDFRIDARVLVFCLGISMLSGVIFTLLPALKLAYPRDPIVALRQRDRRTGAGNRRWLHSLAIVEIAIALTLSFGGALLTKSFYRLDRIDLGFAPGDVLTVQVPLSGSAYPRQAQKVIVLDRILERVRALPGVQSAGFTATLPMEDFSPDTAFTVEGRPPRNPSDVPIAAIRYVSAGYAETIGLTLVKGRLITAADRENTQSVAVITEEMARQAFGNEDPIGKRVRRGRQQETGYPWMVVVGLVRDTKEDRLNFRITRPVLYVPFAQRVNPPAAAATSLVVRSTTDPLALANAVRAAVASVDRFQPVVKMSSMDAILESVLSADRFSARLMAVLAAVGLFLAALGLYGVIAYSVTQRTSEIGLRVALGAQPRSIIGLIVREGGVLIGTGLVLSLPMMVVVARLLGGVLFGVNAHDPAVLLGLAGVLAAVAVLACLVPARRALRLDPLRALQFE